MIRFIEWLFGCAHHRISFPFTPARKSGIVNSAKSTYVVCLDCGKEFGYDWPTMKIGRPLREGPVRLRQIIDTPGEK